MAFGWKQRKNPTPTHIEDRINATAEICLGLSVLANTMPFVNASTASAISWILGAVGVVLMRMKKMWGVETSRTMIPKDQVDVMDEDKKQ